MNLSGNSGSVAGDFNDTGGPMPSEHPGIHALSDVIFYVTVTLGIPGNILSTIAWLRWHVARRNSSAIYLAALAINDVIYLLRLIFRRHGPAGSHHQQQQPGFGWLWRGLGESARILEPLLVLAFTVERLFAILRPLQVSCGCV